MTTPPINAPLRARAHGSPALPARIEPWMQQLLGDPAACAALLRDHGSPVNVLDLAPLAANAQELIEAGRRREVPTRVFVARKANKALAVVDEAHRLGHGIDVGSERELSQVLGRGVPARDIVLTAAIKPSRLLRLAVESGVCLAVDNADELAQLRAITAQRAREQPESAPAPIALRLAPQPVDGIVPTRFGESAARWLSLLPAPQERSTGLRIQGVHFHLHGYDPGHRAEGLRQAIALVDELRDAGHAPDFIDIGGGVPMSYLEDPEPWEAFWARHEAAVLGEAEPLTWRGAGLGLRREEGPDGPRLAGHRDLYPYHQQLIRGPWLEQVLDTAASPGTGSGTVADALRERRLELRCEPGRSMLDGCGLTLARVVFRKRTSDGIPIVGLEMNRTQCRSTSADFLVDPVLVPSSSSETSWEAGEPDDAQTESVQADDDPWDGAVEAHLVGAYCVEAELILTRRITFPRGVAVGDVIALPNTGGYLMHILESASHQIPLAANVIRTDAGFTRDDIDGL